MSVLHFTDEGSGFPLVFIHGYCESHSIWSAFVRPFTSDFRVICPDLPGFGKSPLLQPGFSIADVAREVWSLLDSCSVDRCYVTGHSLGGYVTMEMARQQPERLAGLCMFHSTAYPDDENKKANRSRVMEFVSKNGTPAFVQTLIPSLFADQGHPMANVLLTEARAIQPESIIEYARAMRDRPDTLSVYKTFTKPVLFFAGMKDTVISPQSIHEQALLLQNNLVVPLTEVAHMGMLEAAADTQSAMLKFLRMIQ